MFIIELGYPKTVMHFVCCVDIEIAVVFLAGWQIYRYWMAGSLLLVRYTVETKVLELEDNCQHMSVLVFVTGGVGVFLTNTVRSIQSIAPSLSRTPTGGAFDHERDCCDFQGINTTLYIRRQLNLPSLGIGYAVAMGSIWRSSRSTEKPLYGDVVAGVPRARKQEGYRGLVCCGVIKEVHLNNLDS